MYSEAIQPPTTSSLRSSKPYLLRFWECSQLQDLLHTDSHHCTQVLCPAICSLRPRPGVFMVVPLPISGSLTGLREAGTLALSPPPLSPLGWCPALASSAFTPIVKMDGIRVFCFRPGPRAKALVILTWKCVLN